MSPGPEISVEDALLKSFTRVSIFRYALIPMKISPVVQFPAQIHNRLLRQLEQQRLGRALNRSGENSSTLLLNVCCHMTISTAVALSPYASCSGIVLSVMKLSSKKIL